MAVFLRQALQFGKKCRAAASSRFRDVSEEDLSNVIKYLIPEKNASNYATKIFNGRKVVNLELNRFVYPLSVSFDTFENKKVQQHLTTTFYNGWSASGNLPFLSRNGNKN